MAKKRAKAIGLLSGGLDSILATRLILEQGIEVIGLNFVTPFCLCTKKGCQNQAQKISQEFGIELKIVPLGEEYIALVKQPQYGYGKNLNPCLDCRIFMFRKARELMEERGADFVFTGEVLGERPMSQHLRALKLIEREAGLEGRLLRPLSARILDSTIPENEGLVDRYRLKNFHGRSRRGQMKLAANFKINDYPCPSGGCLLTDKHFAARMRDAFEHNEDTLSEIQSLKYGRHFRLKSGAKVILGRNESENKILENIYLNNDWIIVLKPVKVMGPIAILKKSKNEEDIKIAAGLLARYSDGKDQSSILVNYYTDSQKKEKRIRAKIVEPEELETLRVN